MKKKEAYAKVEALTKELVETLNELNEDYLMLVPIKKGEMIACIGDSNDLVHIMYINAMTNKEFGNLFACTALEATDYFIRILSDDKLSDDVITKLNDAYRERKMQLFPNQNVELN